MSKKTKSGKLPRSAAIVELNSRPKTVLVTGGAGFIGSNLCSVLIGRGDRVICADNLLTGRLRNIASLRANRNFTFLRHDVIDDLQIDGPVDEIYNLACAASPPRYQSDPIHTFKTSVIGAMKMLDLAVEKGARILQASTSEVYGDPEISPQPESYKGSVNTFGPRSCYDEGKRAAETLFHDYHERLGVEIKIARIFNTYGPNMRPDDGRVVTNFIMQALEGKDLTVYGDGKQTRSFCYIDDQVAGLMALMASPPEVYAPVNIGNPDDFTMLDLAELVLEKIDTPSKLVFRDLPMDDPRQRKPDITRALKVLGWSPKVSLSEGLDRTIPYFAADSGTHATGVASGI